MNKLTDKYLTFGILVIGLGASITASHADTHLISANPHTDLVQQATFSPRAYCRTSGGVVSETQDNSLYLCCYESKSKCVVTDTKQSVSWLIPYREQGQIQSRLLLE